MKNQNKEPNAIVSTYRTVLHFIYTSILLFLFIYVVLFVISLFTINMSFYKIVIGIILLFLAVFAGLHILKLLKEIETCDFECLKSFASLSIALIGLIISFVGIYK